MKNVKTRSPKRKILDDFHWFSFQNSFGVEPYLTIWQAIKRLMVRSSFNPEPYHEYVPAISRVEEELCINLAKVNFEHALAEHLPSDFDEYIKYANVSLSQFEDDEIDEWLGMLDQYRYAAIEHLALPRIIYTLLSLEIDKSRNGLTTPLKIKEHKSKRLAYGLAQFSEPSLDTWAAITALIRLDVDTETPPKPKRNPRMELTENRDKLIGMLIHILAELFPIDLKTENPPRRVVISRIEELIGENIKPDKMHDFPKKSIRSQLLQSGYSIIAVDGSLDARSPLVISKYREQLSQHYKAVVNPVSSDQDK